MAAITCWHEDLMLIAELGLISIFYITLLGIFVVLYLSQGQSNFVYGCHLKRMNSHSLNECIVSVS